MCRIALYAACVWLTGCVPAPIDIELEAPEPKLVIASQVIPDKIMFVAVTRSFSSLEMDAENDTVRDDFLNRVVVEDALVTVTYAGNVDTLQMTVPGIYAGTNILQVPGELYLLRVKDVKEAREVSASAKMLQRVNFDTIAPVVVGVGADTTIYVDYEITDLPGNNWYMVNFYARKKGSAPNSGLDISSYFARGENLLLKTVLLGDKAFDASRYSGRQVLEGLSASDSIVVTLSNISEEYYRFLSVRLKAGDWWSQLTKDPVNHPTNIVGGYGFFTTHAPDIRFFDLRNYR